MSVLEVWYTHDPDSWEHRWAEILRAAPGSRVPLKRFGATDCRCESHLFFFDGPPVVGEFRRRIRAATRGRASVKCTPMTQLTRRSLDGRGSA